VTVVFVYFFCLGIFNALKGIRGGEKTDITLTNNINTVLYFTLLSLFYLVELLLTDSATNHIIMINTQSLDIYSLDLASHLTSTAALNTLTAALTLRQQP
jgi:hypothetical protein